MSKDKVSVISTNTPRDIVLEDKKITLSIERLKRAFLSIYEKARKDANKFKIYKYYNVFFSIGITTWLALATADFKEVLTFSAVLVKNTVAITCVGSLIIGVILAFVYIAMKNENKEVERDYAVNKLVEELESESTKGPIQIKAVEIRRSEK